MKKSVLQDKKECYFTHTTENLETWKDVRGYEGLYQVSDCGRIRSCDVAKLQWSSHKSLMAKEYSGKILTPTDNGNGYLIVGLAFHRRKNHYVHRLVADAFVGNTSGMVVNHVDFDKKNNHASNLQVLTQQENVRYSIDRMSKPNTSVPYSASGEKYIYIRKNKYRVCIRQFGVDRSFRNLWDAVKFRNEVMENEKEYFAR